MAKARKTRRIYIKRVARRAAKMTIPVAVVAGLACPVVKAVKAYQYAGVMGQQGAVASISESFTGYNPVDNTFNVTRLKNGVLPVMTGLVVHKLASSLGINRAIASAGIPFIRI